MKKNGMVDLDVLFVERKVRLDGKELVVTPIDGVGYQLLDNVKKDNKGEALLVMYEVAKRCLPNLPEERVMKLSAPQIGALIGVAQAAVEEVEATIPKKNASRGKKGAAST